MKKIPEIRISYGWLVADTASEVLNEKWGDGTALRTIEEYQAIAQKYEEWWKPFNDQILQAMCDTFGLEFRQSIIDIYVVPWFYAISDPMIIGPGFETQDAVVNTLTHELLHRLLTDNTATNHGHDFLKDWRQLFGDLPFNTLVHIPVHAGMKNIYSNVVNRPDLLEMDMKDMADNPDYANAWKYVEEHDYKKIIHKLRKQYGTIAS